LHFAKEARRFQLGNVLQGGGEAVLREKREELLERALVVGGVPVDVRVIELGAGEDGGARPVVQETWGPLSK